MKRFHQKISCCALIENSPISLPSMRQLSIQFVGYPSRIISVRSPPPPLIILLMAWLCLALAYTGSFRLCLLQSNYDISIACASDEILFHKRESFVTLQLNHPSIQLRLELGFSFSKSPFDSSMRARFRIRSACEAATTDNLKASRGHVIYGSPEIPEVF